MENKQKFKNDLKMIEIETFSYCNRKCWFCPNSIVDRKSENKLMNIADYISILNQLKEINFSGEITFSRYNEPLAYKDLILHRIRLARKIVPNAILRINTNGDFLNKDYIFDLRDAGLNELWIQQYLNNDQKYNHDEVKKRMDVKVKKLELKENVLTNIEGFKIEYDLSIKGMTVHIRARNFEFDGSDRGGVLNIAEDYTRTQPCTQVFNNMYIDFNGAIMICCALRSDIKKHESGIMGNISEGKIYDIFYKKEYDVWRKKHINNEPKLGLCKGCKIDVKPCYEK